MTEEAEGLYFVGRELRGGRSSRRARDRRAAEAHAEMAERYNALAVVFGAEQGGDLPRDF